MNAPSVYSYDSSLDPERFIDDYNGRAFNALNKAYCLPSDEIEWQRLDKQHTALRIALGGLTPCQELVDRILAPKGRRKRRVLDFGCGTGIWAIEMAKQYPHASVVGIDVAPPPVDQSQLPLNLRFEIDDVNKGLDHFFNKFHLIHIRCVGTGIHNYAKMMEEIEKCLRPGGLVIYLDADTRILTQDQLHPVHFPGQHGQISWFRKLIYETIEASTIAGSSWDRSSEHIDNGLWERPWCDPATAVSGAVILPIGPWVVVQSREDTQMLQYLGVLTRHVLINVHRGYHRILLDHGIDQATLDTWSTKADEEINSPTSKLWVRFKFCWARKRAGLGLPAPPLPNPQPLNAPLSPGSNSDASASDSMSIDGQPPAYKYPYRVDYNSRLEMQFEILRRNRADVPLPPFEVRRAWDRKQRSQIPH